MRIVIESSDRIGISQEILAIFSKQAWNLKAVEITSCLTYVHVEYDDLTVAEIKQCLASVDGVIKVKSINLLPSEQRENHLQALLDKMPEPIIDVDHNGLILAMNKASHSLLSKADSQYEIISSDYLGKPIADCIKPFNRMVFTNPASSQTITIKGKRYLLDISPVVSNILTKANENNMDQVSGSVLTLRSMNTLGRQISLLQSHQEHGFDSIIGQSKSINLIKAQSRRFAELDLPVLISGETGTGKELIARALHQASSRAKAPFLAINCSALPEHLLESELFGYENGAFTGAQKGGKPGLIEMAEGGFLFLDEIAEMSSYLQAKLLRFLQDLTYRRVGGTKELVANIRIVSASHQNLLELIAKKGFREDLFYRLNVLNIFLPPLRERVSDIELLAKFFIKNAVKQVACYQGNEQAKTMYLPTLSKQSLSVLQHYHWPGNIRQLQSVLFSTVALNKNTDIAEKDLQQALAKFISVEKQPFVGVSKLEFKDWSSAQAHFEKCLLQELYPQYSTTRKLAERLKVSHNKIAMKLREHNIK